MDIGVPRIPNLQIEHSSGKEVAFVPGNNGEKLPQMNSKNNVEQIDKAQLETINSDKPKGDSGNRATDGMGVITDSNDPQTGSTVFNIPNSSSKVSNQKDKVVDENNVIPSLELSLKRLRDFGDTGTSAHDRNVLRHSDLSAFSRYVFYILIASPLDLFNITKILQPEYRHCHVGIMLFQLLIRLQQGMRAAVLHLIIVQRH